MYRARFPHNIQTYNQLKKFFMIIMLFITSDICLCIPSASMILYCYYMLVPCIFWPLSRVLSFLSGCAYFNTLWPLKMYLVLEVALPFQFCIIIRQFDICRYWYRWLYKSTSIILWHPWIQTVSWNCFYSRCFAKLPEFGHCWYAFLVHSAISKVRIFGMPLLCTAKLFRKSPQTFVINHICLHFDWPPFMVATS